MHFRHRHVDGTDRVAQRIGVVRVGARIVHDAVVYAVCLVQAVNELAFVVRLEAVHLHAPLRAVGRHVRLDAGKRPPPVHVRLAHSQHVQVRSVHQHHLLHVQPFARLSPNGRAVATPSDRVAATPPGGTVAAAPGRPRWVAGCSHCRSSGQGRCRCAGRDRCHRSGRPPPRPGRGLSGPHPVALRQCTSWECARIPLPQTRHVCYTVYRFINSMISHSSKEAIT